MEARNPARENRNNYPRRSIARIYNKDELLAEFFGFLPVQFADEIYNAYNYVFYTALESLEEFLRTLDGLSNYDIQDSMQRFENKVEEVLDTKFNIFERYLYDNILMIPKNIDLPMAHYDGLDLSVTKEQEELLDQELEQYRKTVLAQKAFNHMLKSKVAQLDHESQSLQEYANVMNEMVRIQKQNNASRPHDMVRFTVDQCEQLRHSMLQVLQQASNADSMRKLTTANEQLKRMLNDVQSRVDELNQRSKLA